ncbi:MAG: RNA-binding protein [Gammaproteobacteria bacterium]|nr:RNA-binding protein [Gammaproteobacteria bacterium]
MSTNAPKNKIYFGNLAYGTTFESLKSHIMNNVEGTEVLEGKVIEDRETGKSKGFAFITVADEDQANAVCAALNGKDLDGRTPKVMIAEEQKPREGGSNRPRSGGFGKREGGFGGGDRGDRGGYGDNGGNKRSRF